MKIILNDMQKPQENTANQNALRLEVFLFKYLHNKLKLITQENFRKACGNSLSGCKFPVEFQVKLRQAYATCLRTFLAEKKDLSFLASLKKDYPEHYEETTQYLKQFYYGVLARLLKEHHTLQMKFKYAMMATMLSLD